MCPPFTAILTKKACPAASEAIVWNAPRKPEFASRTPAPLCVTLPTHREVFMRLPWLAGCAIIAMLPLLWLPVLPGPCSLAGASALALALIRLHGRAVAGVAMTLLLVVW